MIKQLAGADSVVSGAAPVILQNLSGLEPF